MNAVADDNLISAVAVVMQRPWSGCACNHRARIGALIGSGLTDLRALPSRANAKAGRAGRSRSSTAQQAQLVVYGQAAFWIARVLRHLPYYTKQGSRPAGAMRDGRWKLSSMNDTDRRWNSSISPRSNVGERRSSSSTTQHGTGELPMSNYETGGERRAPRRTAPEPLPTVIFNQGDVELERPGFYRGADSGAWASGGGCGDE